MPSEDAIYPVTFPTDDAHNAAVVLAEVFAGLSGTPRRLFLPAANDDALCLYTVYLSIPDLVDLVSIYREQLLKFGTATSSSGYGDDYTVSATGSTIASAYSTVLHFHLTGAVAVVSTAIKFTPDSTPTATSATTVFIPESSAVAATSPSASLP